jgi:hypothetical protein
MPESFSQRDAGTVAQPCPVVPQPAPHWLEIELVGDDDKPIPFAAYIVKLPDGNVAKGYLDKEGFARFPGIVPGGPCKVCFPELDSEAWEFVQTLDAKCPAPAQT